MSTKKKITFLKPPLRKVFLLRILKFHYYIFNIIFFPFRNAGQCTIQFDDYVIITGGWYGFSNKVVLYEDDGHLIDLNPLVHGRAFHGCGHYIDNDGNMVNIPYLKFLL